MKYLVFAYDSYYPSGASGDFKEAFNTLEEAVIFGKTLIGFDYIDIFDIENKLILEYHGNLDFITKTPINYKTKLENAVK